MATAGSIVVDLLMRTGSFETDTDRATKKAQKQFKDMERQAKETADAISKSIGGVLGGALFGVSLGGLFSKFITETKNAQGEQGQLAAVLRSTGEAAGFTKTQLNQMASSLAGVFSEGDINRAQTRLLSYTGVVGEEFPRALQAAIDMSARMGVEVEQAAETVGRALDVPSAGLSSLSKQGFRFTEDQKKLVDELERAGKMAEAQAIVLGALESSYGGAAEAARNTLGGAMQALQNQIDSLMTGNDGSVNGLTSSVNDLTDLLGSGETKATFAAFTQFLAEVATGLVTVINEFTKASRAADSWLEAINVKVADTIFGDSDAAKEVENITKRLNDNREAVEKLRAAQSANPSGKSTNIFGFEQNENYEQRISALQSAIKAGEARLVFAQGRLNGQDKKLLEGLTGIDETGAPTRMLDPIRATASAPAAKGAKEKVDQGQKLIDQMNQRIALIGKETEYEKLLAQISIGSVTFRTERQKDEALASAQTLDFLNEQTKAYEDSLKQAEALGKVLDELYPDQAKQSEYLSKLATLTNAMENGALSADQYAEAVDRLDQQFGATANGMTEFSLQAARNIQDAMGDTLYDVLSGRFDDIGSKFADMIFKMAANAAAANLAGALFGNFGQSGQIGGVIGTALSGFFGNGAGAAPTAAQVAGAGDGLMFFDEGGYTGPGGKFDPAGIVHAGEYVIPADATRRLGVGFLDRLAGYADGGYVGAASGIPSLAPTNTRVEIINNGTPQQVTGVNRSFDIKGEVISIMVEDMQKNGRSAQAVRGVVGA